MEKSIHVAIIPDANRRWAKKRGLKPWKGHEAGAKNLEKILEAARETGVKHLSFWGSSEDNIRKRHATEVKALLEIYKTYFEKLCNSKKVHDNEMRINVLGEWEKKFPKKLSQIIKKAIRATKNYKKYFVNFFLAYSGDREMEYAINNIAKKYKKGELKIINSNTIKNNLFTKDLPPVDLLIRSGSRNDPHLSSGFMMWDTKDTQLYFSNKDWPDFNKQDFKRAINQYNKRQRRYGG